MLFPSHELPSNSNLLDNIRLLTSKAAFFHSPTIHSARVRNGVFSDGTTFGKLRKQTAKRGSSTLTSPRLEFEKSINAHVAQNWRKDLTENIKEEELERGLRDFLGLQQPFRPNTAASKENRKGLLSRGETSSRIKRVVLGKTTPRRMMTQSSVDKVLRRDLMCRTEASDIKDFTDERTDEKFQYIKFTKASSKDSTKLLKISNYDITLVPSDSRRILLEAIMRDFFLNLIPENSDFLTCKNSQNQIYTIMFTGRLVPTCKLCSSITRFEISRDFGFQILCNSSYCRMKVLYQSKLNAKAYECLWSSNNRPDIEQSLPLKETIEKKPTISRIIQSGKYKITDFSRVITEPNSGTPRSAGVRPNTTLNGMRISTSGEKFNRMMIKTSQTDRSHHQNEDLRPNTVQALSRLTNIRLGSANKRPGTSGSLTAGEFRGAPVLKQFDDKGLFSREKEDQGVIEQVSEEISKNEDEKQIEKRKLVHKRDSKRIGGKIFLPERGPIVGKSKKKGLSEKLLGHTISMEKKSMFGNQDIDNSLEDIHKMVDMLSKGQ